MAPVHGLDSNFLYFEALVHPLDPVGVLQGGADHLDVFYFSFPDEAVEGELGLDAGTFQAVDPFFHLDVEGLLESHHLGIKGLPFLPFEGAELFLEILAGQGQFLSVLVQALVAEEKPFLSLAAVAEEGGLGPGDFVGEPEGALGHQLDFLLGQAGLLPEFPPGGFQGHFAAVDAALGPLPGVSVILSFAGPVKPFFVLDDQAHVGAESVVYRCELSTHTGIIA